MSRAGLFCLAVLSLSSSLTFAAPSRIITLAPSLGELAADLSGGDLSRIVGVSEYTDFPAALARVTSVGPYTHFNLEKVVALKPDLVLATRDGNAKDQVLQLRELGVPVVIVDTASLSQVADSMRVVARAMGVPAVGEAQAARFTQGLSAFRSRMALRVPEVGPRVFLQLGDDPLVTVGRNTFLQEALEAVRATNIYSDSTAHYPVPSLEDAVHRNPEVIVVLALGRDLAPFEQMAKRWKQHSNIAAVKAGRVSVLKGDAILRPTSRLLEGLALLEKAVYGAQ